EARQLDLDDFWRKLGCDNPTPITQMIRNSGIAFAGGFPISVQCVDIVLTCGACFNPESKEVVDVHGE
ncbi:hypothetical protein KI387_032629, partial [Taxus chinensis]